MRHRQASFQTHLDNLSLLVGVEGLEPPTLSL